MSVAYSGNNIVFADGSSIASGWTGFKNRIINGAMTIDQRNSGASVTQTAANIYTLDRWVSYGSQASKMTLQQSSVAPAGFSKSLLITSSSAYSILSSDIFIVRQYIEGLNVADFGWGTPNAVPVTVSFWVRSSLTGVFGGCVFSTGGTYFYPFSYTINSANTWEQKTITIVGPQSGGATVDNTSAIQLMFGLGVGSSYSGTAGSWVSSGSTIYAPTGATSVVGTNGATFYLTGVQLEKGSYASSFDFRPHNVELHMCQRYYEQVGGNLTAYCQSGSAGKFAVTYGVPKRAAPTFTTVASQWYAQNPAATFASGSNGYVSGLGIPGVITPYSTSTTSSMFDYTGTSNTTWTGMVFLFNAWINASAEL